LVDNQPKGQKDDKSLNRRDVFYGVGSKDNDEELLVNLGLVNYSGQSLEKESKVERSKSVAKVRRPTNMVFGGSDEID
jgi:hypothetical protein